MNRLMTKPVIGFTADTRTGAPMAAASSLKIRPTLVIGLGGTGQRILVHLKACLARAYDDVTVGGLVRFLAFALGSIFGFIFSRGFYFYYRPVDSLDAPVKLDNGLANAVHRFCLQDNLGRAKMERVEACIEETGTPVATDRLARDYRQAEAGNGELARTLTAAWGRGGRVFAERFFSRVGRTVRDAFHLVNYVLRNPVAAGLGRFGVDRFIWANLPAIDGDRFLRSVLGSAGPTLRRLLLRMTQEKVPFVPLATRLQPELPW